MNALAISLAEQYGLTLRAFLDGGGEAALLQAQDLGRKALMQGMGLLQVVAIHQAAYAETMDPEMHLAGRRRAIELSTAFLAEALVPFEMRQRGFKESLDTVKLKNQLVALVSHEFANSLSVLQCALIYLEETEERTDPARRKHVFDILKANLKGLGFATTNLLNLGRVDAGKFMLNRRRIRVRSIFKECLSRLEVLYQRKHMDVSLDVPRQPIDIDGDPEALLFVFSNLLSNAVKYTPEKGKIVVGIKRNPDRESVTIYVKDNGIGIAKAEQAKIFSGFYRAEKSRGTSEGFGVGLTLAQRIVEAHGSELKVESDYNQGSRFYFTLPIQK